MVNALALSIQIDIYRENRNKRAIQRQFCQSYSSRVFRWVDCRLPSSIVLFRSLPSQMSTIKKPSASTGS